MIDFSPGPEWGCIMQSRRSNRRHRNKLKWQKMRLYVMLVVAGLA